MVLSDVILADGRGTDLVVQIHEQQPELPVLLATGYTDEPLDLDHMRRLEIPVVQKPFAVAGLMEQVRLLLERS